MGVLCRGKGTTYMLFLHYIHFESRDCSWGISPERLGEMPPFFAGEFPCQFTSVYYVETGNFGFLEYSCTENRQMPNFLNVTPPNTQINAGSESQVRLHASFPRSFLVLKAANFSSPIHFRCQGVSFSLIMDKNL